MNGKLIKALGKIEDLTIEAQQLYQGVRTEVQDFLNEETGRSYNHYTANNMNSGLSRTLEAVNQLKSYIYSKIDRDEFKEKPETIAAEEQAS
jgi:hypothetical protein